MKKKYVSYIRVSTQRQGQSGLGLEAQRNAITDFLNGGDWDLLQEFQEIESGKSTRNRPVLKDALFHCAKNNAILVVAKLDRLARNVAFISAMMESNVDFVCCDFPEANRLTLHIFSAVAEHEREIISKRTKDALQVAKSRGVRLGNPNLRGDNQKRKERADTFAEGLRVTLDAFKAQGFTQERMKQELILLGYIMLFVL